MKIYFKSFVLLSIISLTYTCNSSSEKKADTSRTTTQETVVENSNNVVIKVGKGPDAMFLTPDKQKLYIANVEDTTISVINTQTDQMEKTISGVRFPWGFSRLGNTSEVTVSAYDKQLVVIDFRTDQIVRQRNFDSHLGGVVTSKDGKSIFVIAIDAKKVLQVDAQTLKTITNYKTGNAPDGIGLSANGINIFVTNTEDGTISVIDLSTKISKTLSPGGKPELIHANHNRSLIYISNFKNNTLHIVDSDKGEVIHNISGLDGPEEALPNEDESLLYVVNFNAQKVFVYDTENYSKLASEHNTGKNPIGVIPLRNKLYVTNYGENSVSIISTKN